DPKEQKFMDEDAAWSAIGYVLNLNHQEFNKLLRDWKVSNKTREASLNTLNMLHLFENQDYDLWNIYKMGIDNLPRTIQLCQMFLIDFDYSKLEKDVAEISIKSSHDLALT